MGKLTAIHLSGAHADLSTELLHRCVSTADAQSKECNGSADDMSTSADSEGFLEREQVIPQAKPRWADLSEETDGEAASPQVSPNKAAGAIKVARPRWADMVDDSDNEKEPLEVSSSILKDASQRVVSNGVEATCNDMYSKICFRKAGKMSPESPCEVFSSAVPEIKSSRGEAFGKFTMKHAGKQSGKSRTKGQGYKGHDTSDKARVKGPAHKGHGKGSIPKHVLQCQFTIGIDEEANFRVVRRILGTAGANMKSIAEKTNAKLRLRGRGSKFLEGPEQQESHDDLMLCISAQDLEGYELAKSQVADLLLKIYNDYRKFQHRLGKEAETLQIKIHEGYREGSR